MHASRGGCGRAGGASRIQPVLTLCTSAKDKRFCCASSRRFRPVRLACFVLPSQLRKRSCAPHTDTPQPARRSRAGIARQSFQWRLFALVLRERGRKSRVRFVRRAHCRGEELAPPTLKFLPAGAFIGFVLC
jgi:hypothetical protein